GFASLLNEDRLFALGSGRIDVFGGQSQRIDCSDVHGNLAAECVCSFCIASGFDCNENAELAEAISNTVVDVGRDNALRDGQRSRTTEADVFTDGGNSVLCRFGNGLPVNLGVGNSFGRTIGRQGSLGDLADQILESIVAGNEVGFGVDFNDNSLVAGSCNADQTFGSRTASLLVSLCNTLGAQPVNGSVDVAIGFGKCCLAVHHA